MKIKRINGKPAIAMTAKSGSFLFLAPPLGRELYDLNEIDTTNVAHLKRSERTRQERKNKKTRELHDTTVTTLQIKNHDRIPSDILKSLPSNGNLLVQGYFEEDVPVLARPLCANDQRFPKVLEVGIPDRVQGKSIQHETDLITLGYMFEDDVIEDNQFEEKFVRIDNGLFAPTGKDAPSVVEEKELKENEENFLSSIVNQTQFHNCFFLAAVEALLLTQGMEYFKKRMTDNGDGTTTVTLYHPTSATKKKKEALDSPTKYEVRVDNHTLQRMQRNSHLMPWVNLLENAYVSLGLRFETNEGSKMNRFASAAFPSFEIIFHSQGQDPSASLSSLTGGIVRSRKIKAPDTNGDMRAIQQVVDEIYQLKSGVLLLEEKETIDNKHNLEKLYIKLFEILTGEQNQPSIKNPEKFRITLYGNEKKAYHIDQNCQINFSKKLIKFLETQGDKFPDNIEVFCAIMEEFENSLKKNNADEKSIGAIEITISRIVSRLKTVHTDYEAQIFEQLKSLFEKSETEDQIPVIHLTSSFPEGASVEFRQRAKELYIVPHHCYAGTGVREVSENGVLNRYVEMQNPIKNTHHQIHLSVPVKDYVTYFVNVSWVPEIAAHTLSSEQKDDMDSPSDFYGDHQETQMAALAVRLFNLVDALRVKIQDNDTQMAERIRIKLDTLIEILTDSNGTLLPLNENGLPSCRERLKQCMHVMSDAECLKILQTNGGGAFNFFFPRHNAALSGFANLVEEATSIFNQMIGCSNLSCLRRAG